MALFELKPSNILSTVYTLYPSYESNYVAVSGDIFSDEKFYVFSSSHKTQRTYTDINGNFLTSSYNLSEHITFKHNNDGAGGTLTGSVRNVLNRIRNIYASSSFSKSENYTSSSVVFVDKNSTSGELMGAFFIPQVLHGTEIKRNSVHVSGVVGSTELEAFDDGYGGLYSGSLLVGSIYYQHGIIYTNSKFNLLAASNYYLTFSGTHKQPMNIYMCDAPRGSLNFSNNPSYTQKTGSAGRKQILTSQPKTYITTISLYDKNYQKVGIAKVAQPILNEEKTQISFRLKLNF